MWIKNIQQNTSLSVLFNCLLALNILQAVAELLLELNQVFGLRLEYLLNRHVSWLLIRRMYHTYSVHCYILHTDSS